MQNGKMKLLKLEKLIKIKKIKLFVSLPQIAINHFVNIHLNEGKRK
jgi:hypothetical protein